MYKKPVAALMALAAVMMAESASPQTAFIQGDVVCVNRWHYAGIGPVGYCGYVDGVSGSKIKVVVTQVTCVGGQNGNRFGPCQPSDCSMGLWVASASNGTAWLHESSVVWIEGSCVTSRK